MSTSNLLDVSDQSQQAPYHIPVLFQECMDALGIKADGTYVDCTFGGGGHSNGILERLGPNGKLFAFDQDEAAADNVPTDKRLVFIPNNFEYIGRFLQLYGVASVDGILADLGVSSHQFDEGTRGFSYRFSGPLDMRMDKRNPQTAATLLNQLAPVAMQQMFSNYGEVTNAKTLATKIVEVRQHQPFATIEDLLQVLQPLSKGNPYRYYAQVFQAVRMEVNKEPEVLKALLVQLPGLLKKGGKAAIITFHSLEDRIVKQFFKVGGWDIKEDPIYGLQVKSPFKMCTKKPIEASVHELSINSRSRSAKLRVAEKV